MKIGHGKGTKVGKPDYRKNIVGKKKSQRPPFRWEGDFEGVAFFSKIFLFNLDSKPLFGKALIR